MITGKGITINGKTYRNLENQVAWLTEKLAQKGTGGAKAIAITKTLTAEDLGGGGVIANGTIEIPEATFENGVILFKQITVPYFTNDYTYTTFTYTKGKISIFGMGGSMSTGSYGISFLVIPVDEVDEDATIPDAIDVTKYPNIAPIVSITKTVQFGNNVGTFDVSDYLNVYSPPIPGSNVYMCPATPATKAFLNENNIYLTNTYPSNQLTLTAANPPATLNRTESLSFTFYYEPNGTAQAYIYLLK